MHEAIDPRDVYDWATDTKALAGLDMSGLLSPAVDVQWTETGWNVELLIRLCGASDEALRSLVGKGAAEMLIARREEATEVHQPQPEEG
jgi:hypothetical protein